ncbi:hypothetical protein SAPIO_CDS2879 [Scedosporium apiospermum]|uniref:Uncharacterized protein n=1 Tax=Pseudallescheria apiosperma TaxID=563466 RepID=A0A084GBR4_PSEDA|nr:uncharacterized protein SAPIO_CDS2879 [Scedosporium apiospermum]KEZ44776.1 hypothetical protein SAPIO_CDS2879 [Scedosporium apiospermum]
MIVHAQQEIRRSAGIPARQVEEVNDLLMQAGRKFNLAVKSIVDDWAELSLENDELKQTVAGWTKDLESQREEVRSTNRYNFDLRCHLRAYKDRVDNFRHETHKFMGEFKNVNVLEDERSDIDRINLVKKVLAQIQNKESLFSLLDPVSAGSGADDSPRSSKCSLLDKAQEAWNTKEKTNPGSNVPPNSGSKSPVNRFSSDDLRERLGKLKGIPYVSGVPRPPPTMWAKDLEEQRHRDSGKQGKPQHVSFKNPAPSSGGLFSPVEDEDDDRPHGRFGGRRRPDPLAISSGSPISSQALVLRTAHPMLRLGRGSGNRSRLINHRPFERPPITQFDDDRSTPLEPPHRGRNRMVPQTPKSAIQAGFPQGSRSFRPEAAEFRPGALPGAGDFATQWPSRSNPPPSSNAGGFRPLHRRGPARINASPTRRPHPPADVNANSQPPITPVGRGDQNIFNGPPPHRPRHNRHPHRETLDGRAFTGVKNAYKEFLQLARGWVNEYAGNVDARQFLLLKGTDTWESLLATYPTLTHRQASAYVDVHIKDVVYRPFVITRLIIDFFMSRVWKWDAWKRFDSESNAQIDELLRELNRGGGHQPAYQNQHLFNRQGDIVSRIVAHPTYGGYRDSRVRRICDELSRMLEPVLNRFVTSDKAFAELKLVIEQGWEVGREMALARVRFNYRFPNTGERFTTTSMNAIHPHRNPNELQSEHWRVALVASPAITCVKDTGRSIAAYDLFLADVLCMQ